MNRVRVVVLWVLLALVGSGCVFGDDDGAAGDGSMDGVWVVVEIDGQPVVVGDNTTAVPYVDIDGGDLTGSFGCADGRASFLMSDVVLSVESLTPPTGSCASVAVSFAENALLDVLSAPEVGFTLDDDRMVWVAAGRQLVFEAASAPPS